MWLRVALTVLSDRHAQCEQLFQGAGNSCPADFEANTHHIWTTNNFSNAAAHFVDTEPTLLDERGACVIAQLRTKDLKARVHGHRLAGRDGVGNRRKAACQALLCIQVCKAACAQRVTITQLVRHKLVRGGRAPPRRQGLLLSVGSASSGDTAEESDARSVSSRDSSWCWTLSSSASVRASVANSAAVS